MCDVISTGFVLTGLTLTYASSNQMLQGSCIVVVAVLSVVFLRRVIKTLLWIGIFFVILGLSFVGVSDYFYKGSNEGHSIRNVIGDVMVVIGQTATGIQLVIEEKFVGGLDVPPLQAVALEGMYGFITLAIILIPLHYVEAPPPFSNNARGVVEDVIDALVQIKNNLWLGVLFIGFITSYAFFNFASIGVTKELSATTRIVLDNLRTIIVWVFSMVFMGEAFYWLQLVGFVFMIFGICVYNNLINFSFIQCPKRGTRGVIYSTTAESVIFVNNPPTIN